MTFTTEQDIRDLLGLTIDDAPDDVLSPFITKAQYVILHYIQIQIQDEVVSLDTTGTTIALSNQYISDTNFDKVVNASDVKVYGWSDTENVGSRSTLTVSTIYPDHGIVVLSADASSYDQVTVDYSYYTCAIDWNLLGMAAAYYAGMLWVAKEEFLVPEDLTIGNIRVRQKQPWDKLRVEFLRMIYHITSIPMDKTNYRKMMRSARSNEVFAGPGTTIEREDFDAQSGVGNAKDTT